MIVMIDNYDSFTYNLVQILAGQGADLRIFRNDEISVDEVASMNPDAVIISPGPCTPREAGISIDLIRRLSGVIPILGVCLGHQCIGSAFGGKIVRASRIMHGKTSQVRHDGSALYRGLPNPFPAGRYHSLVVDRSSVPAELVADAFSDDGEIMGMRHKIHSTFGVQFHPESVLTPGGKIFLRNFLKLVSDRESGGRNV